MRKQKQMKRISLLISLIICFCVLVVCYAVLTQNINIDGTAKVTGI